MRTIREVLLAGWFLAAACSAAPSLTGVIRDAETGERVPARLYIEGSDGSFYHARARGGGEIPYRVQRGAKSIEVHTTLPPFSFLAELPPGTYTLTVERGKEYHPTVKTVMIGDEPVKVELELKRWIETPMAERGWFSGDTHVHRKVGDLPLLLRAEDLNVGLPLTSWVTDSREVPSRANKNPDKVPNARLIKVDDTHVIWPVNTEYEIFTVNGKRHTLGAFFILNHKEPFDLAAPPVDPIAREARRQDGIIDLDKHNWPWSMMIPSMGGHQLFELTNNHLWRTEFMFTNWHSDYVPKHWGIEVKDGHYTERGWIEFGFRNYYALLNWGNHLVPSAGTASGVHPVPLGFGRVYVKVDGGFSYDKWIEGLVLGRSFVTTGPMLTFDFGESGQDWREVKGVYEGRHPPEGIEVIMDGKVATIVKAQAVKTKRGGYRQEFSARIPGRESAWYAVRTFEDRPDGRPRFAHTAPRSISVKDSAGATPDLADLLYLIKRVEDEVKRHEGILSEEAVDEFRWAVKGLRKRLPDK
jgi:hypothetical protein